MFCAIRVALACVIVASGSARRNYPSSRQRSYALSARRAPQTAERATLLGRRVAGRPGRGRLLSLRGGGDTAASDASEVNEEAVVARREKVRSFGRLKRWLLSARGGADDASVTRYGPSLGSRVAEAMKGPLSLPPLTRSWLSIVLAISIASATGKLDLQKISTGGPMLRKGEWWRAILNFFFMGDSIKSIFFWFQILNSYDFLKTLEVAKYRWEPGEMVRMIASNAVMLSILRLFFPWNVYLGAPLASAFLYLYTREFDEVPMNFLGVFSIQTGWLPYVQMAQDFVQTGDISPNLLGLISGHIYYFWREVLPLAGPEDKKGLRKLIKLFFRGQAEVIDWSSYHNPDDDDDELDPIPNNAGDDVDKTLNDDTEYVAALEGESDGLDEKEPVSDGESTEAGDDDNMASGDELSEIEDQDVEEDYALHDDILASAADLIEDESSVEDEDSE